MNKKAILSSLAVSATAIFLLSGCAQTTKSDNLITFSEKAPITSVPSWSSSSVSFLISDGWDVQTVDSEDVPTAPKTFYATNKDNTCSITYSSTVDGTENKNTDEEYLTQERAYLYTDSLSATETTEGTPSIKIANSKDTLQMLQVSYTAPKTNYAVSDGDIYNPDSSSYNANALSQPPQVSSNGIVKGYTLSRVFDTKVVNPFASSSFKASITNEDEAENNVPSKTGRPIINVKYECANIAPDTKIWQKIVDNATIVLGKN